MSRERDCYVYIIATVEDGRFVAPVKVGITHNIRGRLATIQNASPREIKVVFTLTLPEKDMARQMESCFHSCQKAHRLKGEWFDMPPADAVVALTIYFRWMLDLEGVREEIIPGVMELSGANRCNDVVSLLKAQTVGGVQ